jgi:hypothetical protein
MKISEVRAKLYRRCVIAIQQHSVIFFINQFPFFIEAYYFIIGFMNLSVRKLSISTTGSIDNHFNCWEV